MFSQGTGKGNFVVEAQNVKLKDDYIRMDVKDANTSVKGVVYITRPGLNILETCKKINDEDRYHLIISDFKAHTRNEKLML